MIQSTDGPTYACCGWSLHIGHAPECKTQILHIRDQSGQPYGSERRCCNWCGVMIWEGRSNPMPRFTTDQKAWSADPNNCFNRRSK